MITVLLSIAGLLLALTLVSVYSAIILAHRTDNLINKMMDDNPPSNRGVLGQI